MLSICIGHPHHFQDFSSLDQLSLAAAFPESDSYELGLINSSTVTHVDVEAQDSLASAADYDTNQSGLQIQDMPLPPDNEM